MLKFLNNTKKWINVKYNQPIINHITIENEVEVDNGKMSIEYTLPFQVKITTENEMKNNRKLLLHN